MVDRNYARYGFPMIYPLNTSGTGVEGFMRVMNRDMFIHLKILGVKPRKKLFLRGCWNLTCLLKPEAAVVRERLSGCSTIPDMLVELKNFLENKMRTRSSPASDNLPVEYYQALMKNMQTLNSEIICAVDSDLKIIKIKACDVINQEHILQLRIPPNFPQEGPSYTFDLPESFSFDWTPANTFREVFDHFENTLKKYFYFWRWMNEIDENTWVLGPENITPATCKRRIAIAPMVSLVIVVNPSCPSALPSCQYMGPDEVIQPLQEMFSRNIDQWDEGLSILANLRRAFNVDFPSPLTTSKEEFCVDCGICYTYKLENFIPEVICSNSKCHKPYHQVCLYEWLKMSKSAMQTNNKIGGECPCCDESIWCGLPELDSGRRNDLLAESV